MSVVRWLLCGVGLSLVAFFVACWFDGWPPSKPYCWESMVRDDLEYPWRYRWAAILVPALWLGVLAPLTRTRWWDSELSRWGEVCLTLIGGEPGCCCRACDPSGRKGGETAVRYGVMLASIGFLFIGADLLELHKCLSLGGAVSDSRAEALHLHPRLHLLLERPAMLLELLAGMSIIGLGLASSALWMRSRVRLWLVRIVAALSFVALFAQIADYSALDPDMRSAGLRQAYMEGIAAVWMSATAAVAFMAVGWSFAERSAYAASERIAA